MKKIILFSSMLCVLISLGVWQVFRLDYKNALIEQVRKNKNLPAISLSDSDELSKHKYENIQINGRFNTDATIFYYRLKNNIPGYEVLTPLVLSDDRCVLVSRGWVEKQSKIQDWGQDVRLEGFLIDLYKKNIVNPKNDLQHNIWFSLEIADIKKNTGLN